MQLNASVTAKRLIFLGKIKAMRLKIASQVYAKQAVFIALALMLGVGGIGMLMLCLYTVMAEAFGLVVGALTTASLLFAMSVATVLLSYRIKAPSELQILDELEETVVSDITTDLAQIELGFRKLETGTAALFKGDYITAFANLVGSFK